MTKNFADVNELVKSVRQIDGEAAKALRKWIKKTPEFANYSVAKLQLRKLNDAIIEITHEIHDPIICMNMTRWSWESELRDDERAIIKDIRLQREKAKEEFEIQWRKDSRIRAKDAIVKQIELVQSRLIRYNQELASRINDINDYALLETGRGDARVIDEANRAVESIENLMWNLNLRSISSAASKFAYLYAIKEVAND